ncbi:MAG: site-specific integrase [Reichenbachiella sp.]|uniref:tyrosine-type recombinase/integrase n=1 Tax=Reichenbachiella sp. TaxID=2184521 RepID=UPI003266DE4A
MVSHSNTKSSTPNSTPGKTSSTPKYIGCNDLSIKAIRSNGNRTDYWFSNYPGFGMRVTPKGTKTFVYVYSFSNKKYRLTFGQYPKIKLSEARKKYIEALEAIEHGINPATKRKKAKSTRITVKEAIDIYEKHGITKQKVSIQEEIRALRKDLETGHGSTWIRDMESSDFDDILMTVLNRGSPQMANHLYKYIHRMCEVLKPKYLNTNPVSALELPATIGKKSRALTFSEIHTLWYSLPQTPMQLTIQLALKFILVTMQRGKDIRLMEFNEYNAKDKIWTIPNPKNGREWRVPLNKYGVEILEALKMMKPGIDHPFLLDAGNLMDKDTLSKSVSRERMNFGIEHFTPHDLRRTAATLITSLGCPPTWAALMLNHTDNSVTSIYDQYGYDYEKRLSANVLEFALDQILNCRSIDEIPNLDEMRELVKQAKILSR